MFYIYLMRAGQEHYKVGVTKNLTKRIKSIQTSNPNKVELVTAKLVDLPYTIEADLHKSLVELSSGGGTEWFKLKPTGVVELCIHIQSYPHIEISDSILVREMLDKHLHWKKSVEKKLDIVLNNYQKGIVRTLNERVTPTMKQSVPHIPVVDVEEEIVSKAIAVIKATGKASTSLLQRKLGIGYGRAARIIDELEEREIITAINGNNPRQLIVKN